jgi:hypothetical protein
MILISLTLFALSGKRILLVRKGLRVTELESPLHNRSCRPRERVVSSFSRPTPLLFAPNSRGGSVVGSPSLVTTPGHFDMKELPLQSPAICRGYGSLISSSAPSSPRHETWSTAQFSPQKLYSRFDSVAWKYAKFAFLYTLVLIITWVRVLTTSLYRPHQSANQLPQVPISINRVYNNFIAPGSQVYGLYLVSSICIPLQGFGNFVIYTSTSWRECREFLSMVRGSKSIGSQSGETNSC